MSLPTLTDRQRKSLDEIKAELQTKWHLYAYPELHFEDESRPGRGNDVRWTCCDGERVAFGRLDVYGNGSGISVADIDWLHSDNDDECECEYCTAERAEDDE